MEKIYKVQMNSSGMPNFATAVEIADRPQGEWEDYDRYMKCCSKCGWIHDILHYGDDYCPHCGARMKGASR